MKHIISIFTVVMAAVSCGCNGNKTANITEEDETSASTAVSIVKNGGFEVLENGTPVEWPLPDGYEPAPGKGRNGTAAIAFAKSQTAEKTRPVMQKVTLDGGEAYNISCWVKIDGRRGANIGLEWFDANGKFASTYSANLKGPADWTLVTVKTPKLPAKLKSCNVLLCASYVSNDGTVLLDDVSIDKCEMKPIAGLYTSAYRGVVAKDETFTVKASLNIPQEMLDGNAAIVALRYLGTDGELHTIRPSGLSPDVAEFSLRGGDLAPGEQMLACAVATNGVKAGKSTCRIERSEKAGKWRVRFDRFGRTIVDGKPFFPLGMYMARATKTELDAYREAPFNCVMPYYEPTKEDLDLCAAADLKVVFSLKDAYRHKGWAKKKGIKTEADEVAYVTDRVNAFKSHPAVLAWYHDDESGPEYAKMLAKRRDLFERLDADHPTWICLYQIHQLESYMGAFDVIGTDPYPVARSPLSLAANWTRITFKNTLGVRPVWMVPQAFSWKWYPDGRSGDRMPTEAEMRAMSWQMIACGANGLIYYAFHNIRKNSGADYEKNWSAVKTVASEIASRLDVLLSDPGPAAKCGIDAARLPVRTWRRGEETFVLAVNATPDAVSAEIVPDGSYSLCKTLFGASANLSDNNRLSINLPPWGQTLVELRH